MSKMIKGLVIGIAILGVVGTVASIEKVKPGYVGVVYTPSTGTQDETLHQGWHLVSPFKKVTQFSVATEQLYLSQSEREGSKSDDSFEVRCLDGKMNIDFEMSYSFNSDKIPALFTKYRGMSGEDILSNIVKGKIKTYVNEVTSGYSVLDAHMLKKAQLNNDILAYLQTNLEDFGINVESANLMETRVDASIEAAITERSKAAQELEAEKQKQEKAKVEAERLRIEAEGKKAVAIIEAEAEAEKNSEINKTLTPEMLQQMFIEKWDGKLSIVSGSESNIILKDLMPSAE